MLGVITIQCLKRPSGCQKMCKKGLGLHRTGKDAGKCEVCPLHEVVDPERPGFGSGGFCKPCTSGDPIRSDGTCGRCPDNEGNVDGYCKACSAGQVVRSDGTCGVKEREKTSFTALGGLLPDWQRTATNMNSFIFEPIFPRNSTDCTVPEIITSSETKARVKKFQESYRKVAISLGQFSVTCGKTDRAYYDFLDQVISSSGIQILDFDIEGWVGLSEPYTAQIYSDDVISRTARVIIRLKRKYPSLFVIFTVQAKPDGQLWKWGGNKNGGQDAMNVLKLTKKLKAKVDRITPMLVGWYWDDKHTPPYDASNTPYFERYRDTTIALAKSLQKNVYPELSDAKIYSMLGIEVDSRYTKDPETFAKLYTWANEIGLADIVFWGWIYTDNKNPDGTYKDTTLNPIPKRILEASGVKPYK